MTRTAFPMQVDDLSAFARSLQSQLAGAEKPASHLTLMNMLARAAGYKNFQHFRSLTEAQDRQNAPSPAPDMARVEQVLRYFDKAGRLAKWPAKTAAQKLALWGLWAQLPVDQTMSEREISVELNRWHLFGDAAIIRRTMWEMKLVTRNLDGAEYRRVGQAPPPEARALIRALRREALPTAGLY